MKSKLLGLSFLTFAAFNALGGTSHPLELWYAQPAAKWLEALPIGNGSLGGMVFGGTTNEHIQFNEQTLWLGSESEMGSYQPFGDVFLDWTHPAATDYRRELVLADATHRVIYRASGIIFQREAFSSYPDQVMVVQFTANQSGAYSGAIRLTDMHGANIRAVGNKLIAVGRLPNGLDYESQVWVHNDGGALMVVSNNIVVTKADSVTLLLAAGTSFANDPLMNWRGKLPHERITQKLETASTKSFAQLYSTHTNDYENLFNRVRLDLGPANADLPTSERLAAYKAGKADPALEALLFQYGRYLLISSSRPGGLPANLQGIWNDDLMPKWHCGFTTDINVEMNYWLAETTALPECMQPFFLWVQNLAVVGKRTKEPELQTTRGWYNYCALNPMGASTHWGVNKPGSAWLMQPFWEHYAFTQDRDFLRSVAYPAMKDIVGFWEHHLVAQPDGKLITPDGWSPEHGPVEEKGKIVIKGGDRTAHPGVTYDQEIVWELFGNYIEASEALGVDAEYRAKISSMRDRLLGPQVGHWGQIQEWMEDVDDPQDQHRHLSHLFALYPGHQISPLTTPNLAAASRVTLNARSDRATGWSKAWKINLWARLQDGNRAHQLINELIKASMLENLFDSAPPFQMDGNFGYTSGVTEMLLQSQIQEGGDNLLELLPALPDNWPEGSVTGLRTRGGFSVDLTWRQGKLVFVRIFALNGHPCRVLYGNQTREVAIKKGDCYQWAAWQNNKW